MTEFMDWFLLVTTALAAALNRVNAQQRAKLRTATSTRQSRPSALRSLPPERTNTYPQGLPVTLKRGIRRIASHGLERKTPHKPTKRKQNAHPPRHCEVTSQPAYKGGHRADPTPYRHWNGTIQAYKRANQTDILKKGGGILADTQHEERTGPR